jgi:hypothetical protein
MRFGGGFHKFWWPATSAQSACNDALLKPAIAGNKMLDEQTAARFVDCGCVRFRDYPSFLRLSQSGQHTGHYAAVSFFSNECLGYVRYLRRVKHDVAGLHFSTLWRMPTNGVFTKYPTIPALNYGVWSGRQHGFVRLSVSTNQSRFRVAGNCVPAYSGFFAKILPYVRQKIVRKGPNAIHIYSEDVDPS